MTRDDYRRDQVLGMGLAFIDAMMAHITYKSNCNMFFIYNGESSYIRLEFMVTCVDSGDENQLVGKSSMIPEEVWGQVTNKPKIFMEWLRKEILDFEAHEMDEWIRFDGKMPFNPHKYQRYGGDHSEPDYSTVGSAPPEKPWKPGGNYTPRTEYRHRVTRSPNLRDAYPARSPYPGSLYPLPPMAQMAFLDELSPMNLEQKKDLIMGMVLDTKPPNMFGGPHPELDKILKDSNKEGGD